MTTPRPRGAPPHQMTSIGEFGFEFIRYGVRVPTMLVSPLIPAGTVHRIARGSTPFDHTSVLATLEHRWDLPALTHRDAAASDVAGVLTLTTPRTDDPLDGVTAPAAPTNPTGLAVSVSHLQQVQADLIAAASGRAAEPLTALQTNADYQAFIDTNG